MSQEGKASHSEGLNRRALGERGLWDIYLGILQDYRNWDNPMGFSNSEEEEEELSGSDKL